MYNTFYSIFSSYAYTYNLFKLLSSKIAEIKNSFLIYT